MPEPLRWKQLKTSLMQIPRGFQLSPFGISETVTTLQMNGEIRKGSLSVCLAFEARTSVCLEWSVHFNILNKSSLNYLSLILKIMLIYSGTLTQSPL